MGREVQPSRCQIWERREFYPGKTIFMEVINSGSARSKPIRISPRRTSRAGFAGAVHCLVTKVNVAVQNWVECTYDSIQFDLGKRYSRRQSLPMIFPTPFLFSSHLSGGLTTAIHMPSPRLKRGGYVQCAAAHAPKHEDPLAILVHSIGRNNLNMQIHTWSGKSLSYLPP